MSKNNQSQTLKTNPYPKLDNLLNSYNLLKSILSPNLNENNNLFMNSLIELIISQLKLFIELLYLTETKKIYEVLNTNSQNLSKQIAYLYEISKFSEIVSNKSVLNKPKNENLRYIKESYSLEEPKQSFNIMDSNNFDLIEKKDSKDSKEIKNIENLETRDSKEIKINKNDKLKEKKLSEKDIEKEREKEKEREREKEREKLIKREKEEREKLKEKEKIIQNLKKQEKDIREKARKIIKKAKIKEKEKQNNKTQLKKN